VQANDVAMQLASLKFGSFSLPTKKPSWADMVEEEEGMSQFFAHVSSHVTINSNHFDHQILLAPLFDQVAAHES
jgi:hypothetical protein